MRTEKHHTEVFACRHCGNSAPMEIAADHDERHFFESHTGEVLGEPLATYQLCICPACEGVCLRLLDWVSGEHEPRVVVLYPQVETTEAPRGLPEPVAATFQASQRVRSVDPNAYAVLLGRVLETVCGDRQADGDTLAKKLEDLSVRGEIPQRLVEVARGLRRLRNVGAHADLGELSETELPVLDNLTRAILEYVYTAPILVADAEECLKRLKQEAERSLRRRKTDQQD